MNIARSLPTFRRRRRATNKMMPIFKKGINSPIKPPTDSSNWILKTGFWRDLGVWEDTAQWID